MKKEIDRKPRVWYIKVLIFLLKIPFLIFVSILEAKSDDEEEPDIIEDLYMQNPNLFNPKPPRDK